MKPQPRRINWLDMIVEKPDETSLFYERVFGFVREALQEDEEHTSYFVKDGDENVLGICDAGVFPDWVSGWLPYIDVEDFDHSVSQIVASGGKIQDPQPDADELQLGRPKVLPGHRSVRCARDDLRVQAERRGLISIATLLFR